MKLFKGTTMICVILNKNMSLYTSNLQQSTWMKRKLVIFSINRLQSILCKETLNRHEKKLDTLIVNKCVTEWIKPNPNKIITNLTNCELTENEVEVLRLGLKHDLILQPKETEMIAVIEDLWDQI